MDDILKAVKTCFNKYADFNGRAARPEFWWFFLFQVVVLAITGTPRQMMLPGPWIRRGRRPSVKRSPLTTVPPRLTSRSSCTGSTADTSIGKRAAVTVRNKECISMNRRHELRDIIFREITDQGGTILDLVTTPGGHQRRAADSAR